MYLLTNTFGSLPIALAMSALCYLGLLFACALIDIQARLIPNKLVFSLCLLRIAIGIFCLFCGSERQVFEALIDFWVLLFQSVLFSAIVMVLFWLSSWILSNILHETCVGMGDIKLLGAGSLFLTCKGLLAALLVAAIVALIWALFVKMVKKERTFPFGPALAAGLAYGFFV